MIYAHFSNIINKRFKPDTVFLLSEAQSSKKKKKLSFNASDSGNSTNGRWAGALISCPGAGVSHLRAIIQLHNETPSLSLSPKGESGGGIAPLRI